MIFALIFRLLLSLWLFVTIISSLCIISRIAYDPRFKWRKALRACVYTMCWPFAMFSEAGRAKLNKILED